MRAILAVFLLIVAVLGLVWLWPRIEGEPPVLSGPERIALGRGGASVEVSWEDPGQGLRDVRAVLRVPLPGQGPATSGSRDDGGAAAEAQGREIVLFERAFRSARPGDPVAPVAREVQTLELDPAAMDLPDGEALLVLEARDAAWSGFGAGNKSILEIPVVVDTTPPKVAVASGLTYVRRGGAGLARYRVDGEAARTGIRVGEAWFPGLRVRDDVHVAVFAIPVEAPARAAVEVVGIDAFGNEASAVFDVRVRDRSIPEISIPLSGPFLDRVVRTFAEEAEEAGLADRPPVEIFQHVNTVLRERNEAVIAEAIPAPSEAAWRGAFEQMRGSKVTSEFAELRHYTRAGRRVSRARHYGYDLASTARAPITAANAGTVVFAGDNGIYGNLVMIDHGLGITTLYGHLSRIDVAVGDAVDRGQVLGRSGATGLAGGDHLHFAVLVGRTYVDPLEWWDGRWIEDHIEARLGPDEARASGG